MPGVYLHSLVGVSQQSRTDFALDAIWKLIPVVNDSNFQKRIRTANYRGRKFRIDRAGMHYIQANNALVFNQVMGGKEFRKQPNGVLDLSVKIERLGARTVGRVRPPDPLITTNSLFFEKCYKKNDPVSLAAHWMHEWLHVSGFRHVPIGGKPDREDVPYTIGRLVVQKAREQAEKAGLPLDYVEELGQGYLDAYWEHADTVEE